MSEGELFLWLFIGIIASPLIVLWMIIAAAAYVLSGGRIDDKWWDAQWARIEPKMSGNFWACISVGVIALDIVLICGGYTRYRINHNLRVGEDVPLTWSQLNNELVLEKNLLENTWRWNYGSHDIDVVQMCPTFGRNHDAVAKVDGQVQASTDAHWLSSYWEYKLRDNTGAHVYTVKATSGKAAIMEYLGISLSVVVLDLDGNPVAYVEGDSFIVDDFTMKDKDGYPILTFTRNLATLEAWQWEIKAVNQTAENFKPVYAAVMAGHHAFDDPNLYTGKNRTDMCNWWFNIAVIFLIIGGCLMASWLCAAYYAVRDLMQRGKKPVPVLNEVVVDSGGSDYRKYHPQPQQQPAPSPLKEVVVI